MSFTLDEAIWTADQAVSSSLGRPLSDVEILILKGAWDRLEYDQIAAQHQYSTSYISNDIAPKLWKALSDASGEKVRKSNFKAALQRYWEICQDGRSPLVEVVGSGEQNPATDQPVTSVHPLAFPASFETYIERPPAEVLCYEASLKPGALIRIKAPRYMGKTALASLTLDRLAQQDCVTIYLSFQLAERKKHLTDLNQFLRWFCLNISRDINQDEALDSLWDEAGMGAKVSCTTYVEQCVLAHLEGPVILCLDDVDLLFPFPDIYEDFFGLLRSWHEKARSRQLWQKLRLMVVHSTDVYIHLNIHQSPFNVGLPINLPDFTLAQAQAFAQGYGLTNAAAQVEQLMLWVGGHPYLLKQALTYLTSQHSVALSQLLAEITSESSIYSSHLRELLFNLWEEPILAEAFKKITASSSPVPIDSIVAYKLQSMGLINLMGNAAEPRCQLYRQYFREKLNSGS